MTREKDIVADIIGRIDAALRQALANELGFEQSVVDEVSRVVRAQDAPVRQHWARSEAYVPARPPEKEEAKQRALEEVRRNGNVAEASSRHGVSRATLYRLLGGGK